INAPIAPPAIMPQGPPTRPLAAPTALPIKLPARITSLSLISRLIWCLCSLNSKINALGRY
ncbi:hypothetical protein, partial [Helicobacter suis]|uniref:hypothetical protein n=1 Tax=Helicobacter suis TaxID=104628 RepID=UPI001967A2FC